MSDVEDDEKEIQDDRVALGLLKRSIFPRNQAEQGTDNESANSIWNIALYQVHSAIRIIKEAGGHFGKDI